MAGIPQYAVTPRIGAATLTTADTSTTTPSTVGVVLVGGINGSRVDSLALKGLATTVTGLVRWFLFDGTNYTLVTERLVPAVTSSTTSPTYEDALTSANSPDLLPIILPNDTWSIRATTTVNQTGIRARVGAADL